MSKNLRTLLGDALEPVERHVIFSSYDVIGDIIIMKIPNSLQHKKYTIGKLLLESLKHVKCVFLQTSSVDGDFRLRRLELLAGVDRTVTEYHEHGCRFRVDVGKVYFSPRLSTERHRIAERVRDNEIITNMFAGVGTFSILIAKQNPCSTVYSIDSNPKANNFCLVNTRLNNVQDRVFPLCGDAKYIAGNLLAGLSDRVLMPLPEKAMEFVDSAVACLRNNRGSIHYFAHIRAQNRKDAVRAGKLATTEAFRNYNHELGTTRIVREVGPRLYQIVSDVLVR
ncbi:MAG TPA: class I SAM-dependent methyltransferase family protein [Nitrososphaeraceae archaeon]|nr:class I SAM-dependent methyltransferase family protein [Nitrososphaeraceae archaeon]